MRYMLLAVFICLSVSSTQATDEKHREARAHAHGHGKVSIAIEGKRLSIELEAPGADIVGFEHDAKTDAEKAAVAAATAVLEQPGDIMELPLTAGCKVVKSHVELHRETVGDEHSEFHVEYELECATIAKLSQIDFSYFTVFKRVEALTIEVVTNKGASKFEATPQQPTVQFGALN